MQDHSKLRITIPQTTLGIEPKEAVRIFRGILDEMHEEYSDLIDDGEAGVCCGVQLGGLDEIQANSDLAAQIIDAFRASAALSVFIDYIGPNQQLLQGEMLQFIDHGAEYGGKNAQLRKPLQVKDDDKRLVNVTPIDYKHDPMTVNTAKNIPACLIREVQQEAFKRFFARLGFISI